ncbi:hypothetical protein ACEWY4_020788 [Coilia grayii]|uniref:BEN domain-containing protein n=1 Tax=Coilia grayii TaxID=363190 RepID=A0ABD1J746_9TELE
MDDDGNPISKYSAYIEWRHGRKPRGGWPHYRGHIVFVSASRFETMQKLSSILKMEEKREAKELPKRLSVAPQKYGEESDDSTDIDTPTPVHVKRSKVSHKAHVDPAEEFLKLYGQQPPSSDDYNNLRKTVNELRQENKDLKEGNERWKEMVLQDVPGLLISMRKVVDAAAIPTRSESEMTIPPQTLPSPQPPSRSSSVTSKQSSSSPLPSSQLSKVEIYPGSGVLVDKLAWAYALNSTSATVFVRHLLTAVFPHDILLVSNLRGSSRGKGDARLPLDKNKLDAIYNATLERWPGTQLSSIGTTINAKITELRSKAKSVTT